MPRQGGFDLPDAKGVISPPSHMVARTWSQIVRTVPFEFEANGLRRGIRHRRDVPVQAQGADRTEDSAAFGRREEIAMTTALITGCSSGFGERAALALARKGVRVAAGVRDFGRARGLVDAAANEKLPVELVKLDVRNDESVAGAVDDVHECMGAIDVAITNAGLHLIARAELCAIADCQAIFDTNVLGALRVMKAVLPEMRARHRGRIVVVTSAGSFVAVPHMAMYTAS